MMTEDDGEWFTDSEHHWQASDLVKCVVSTAAPLYKQSTVQSRISKAKVKVKFDRAFELLAAFINSSSPMPAFYIQYNYLTI